MKNKKSRGYSLSAKQRKELRIKQQADEAKAKNKIDKTADTHNEIIEDSKAVKKISSKKIVLSIAFGLCGLLLILFAILLPVVIFPKYYYIDNPVARFELSTGDVIEVEIYENEYPIAATNFLFLAKQKLFDGVLVYDNQNSYMRFGSFTTYKNSRITDDAAYLEKLSKLPSFKNHKKNPLGYTLRTDSSSLSTSLIREEGYIALMSGTSTEFQICGLQGAQLTVTNTSTKTVSGNVFGKCINQESIDVVKKLGAMANADTNGMSYFKGPVPEVRIQRVKIYNLGRNRDDKKWKNFNFEEYMRAMPNPDGGNSIDAIIGWSDDFPYKPSM